MGEEKEYSNKDLEKGIGYVRYVEVVCELNKLLDNLRRMRDEDGLYITLDSYEKELSDIQTELAELEKNEENTIKYSNYKSKVKKIIEKVEEYYNQLKILDLYACRINEFDAYNDNQVIENGDTLVRLTNELMDKLSDYKSAGRTDEEKKVLKNVSNAFYNALILEATLDRCVGTLYNMLNYSGHHPIEKVSDTLRNKISDTINDLCEKYETFDIDPSIDDDNIQFDIFRSIAKFEKPFLFPKAEEAKEKIKRDLKTRYEKIVEEKEYLDKACEERLKIVQCKTKEKNKIQRRRAFFAAMPIVFSIISGILVGHFGPKKYIGKSETYDKKTKEVIEETVASSDEYYAYKMKIKVCSPWYLFEDGKTYIRNVAECLYVDNENANRQDPDEILKRVEDRKVYIETKDTLDEEDSLTEPKVYVTESYFDKDKYDVNTTNIVLYVALGAFLGFVLVNALYLETEKNEADRLELKEIKKILESGISREVVIERYEKIGDKFVKLREEYMANEDRYDDLEFRIDPVLLESAKSYAKKFK